MKWHLTVASAAAVLAVASGAQAIEIPLTLREPAGLSRVSENVTSGVPLPPGTQTSAWSLWDGAQEIPLQVTPLPGRTPWILLDFATDLSSGGAKSLVLREGTGSPPARPIVILDDATGTTVETGRIKARISRSPYNLIESVWLDRNGDGLYGASEQVIAGGGDQVQVLDASTGLTFSGAGTPARFSWEYRGPVRSTLRVDGAYRNGSTKLMDYTTRITFYAGRSDVRIDHLLRNTYQTNERHVKIRSATLQIGSGSAAVRATRPGSIGWVNVGAGGATFQVVPAMLWNIDTATNGGMLVPDLSFHGASVIADFGEGISSSEQSRLAATPKSPLFALAPAAWYSQYGELSTTRPGTLDDERQANTLWGWAWSPSQEPNDAHNPDYAVSWRGFSVHDDLEADDVWQNLMMYVRTGHRGYWDRTMAWARYHKWEFAMRTDGFEYAWDSDYEHLGPQYYRPLIPIPLTSADNGYLTTDVRLGKVDVPAWGADHMFGWGLVDYYYLTGDTDALEAAIDLAEIAKRVFAPRVPGEQYQMGSRWGARNMLITSRVWEVTQNDTWRNLMSHFVELVLQAPDYDPRGVYYLDHSSGGKLVVALYLAPLTHALEQYYKLTGDSRVRDRLIAMSRWVADNALHLSLDYSSAFIVLDHPTPNSGNLWFDRVSPFYTSMWVDTIVRGFRLTGDPYYLARAKRFWEQGSKSVDQPARRVYSDTQCGKFANDEIYYNGLYANNGDLPYVHLLFYDATHSGTTVDTTPPAPPRGLSTR